MSPAAASATSIRPAKREDVPVILAFIRELAEYERLAHEVVATEDLLATALFGPRPEAEVLIACAGGAPVGFALFFANFSTFQARTGLYLEDLFVRPAFRRKGVARGLFRALARKAVAEECGRFEWSVLDWNENAIRFYRELGASPLDEWTAQRLSGEALRRLAAEA